MSIEVLDHLICSLERQLLDGKTYSEAVKEAFKAFTLPEINHINENYKQLKKLKMLKRIIIPISFVLCLCAFAIAQIATKNNQWQPPIADTNINVSSEYGYRIHPISKTKKLHKGIDYVAPLGTKVFAVKEGIVKTIKKETTGYGNSILILHDDSTQSFYAQLHEIFIEEGTKVDTQTPIGTVGSSGQSTGPHLHFELLKNGKQVNPTTIDSVFIAPK